MSKLEIDEDELLALMEQRDRFAGEIVRLRRLIWVAVAVIQAKGYAEDAFDALVEGVQRGPGGGSDE